MNTKFSSLKFDFFGGLTSAIVALPLALAFGVASGLGPTAGLIGAIVLGFFASLLGGTPLQISGPTGPMTVIVAGLALKYNGNLEIIFSIIILCGIIQSLFGVFRLGAYVNYVPLPVISGFMTGIGSIIILMQLLPVLGDYSNHNGLQEIIAAIPAALENSHAPSLSFGLVTFLFVKFFPKNLSGYIPPQLLALTAGTAIAAYYFPDLKTIGEISTSMPELRNFSPTYNLLPEIITASFMLALLGSIDTLLTSTVADKITKTRHDSDKELIAQGIGNALVGFVGGLPGAGATMRTVVNIKAGAKTRLSGMLHSVIMLIVVVFLGTIAEKIPLCILAGILLKVGIDIIDWDFLRKLRFYPKDKVLLMFTVLILTIFSDLVTSIGLGLILSHMIYSKKMHKSQLNQIQVFEAEEDETPEFSELVLIEKENSRSARVKLSGSLNYSVVKDLTQLINNAAANRQNLILDFEDIVSIDISIASAIEDILKSLKGEKTVKLKIKQDETYNMLRSLGILKLIDTANIQILEKDGK
ncbi:MAG: SulP family inorganic anion transporter [Alphaproteobacteria bacterium]|nr:SulP family inorganic anion transporter [Alphaproteobacteria bacterium]HRW29545.1 SulP family inorganic anion transporter [Emcibacteraceae bacterium]